YGPRDQDVVLVIRARVPGRHFQDLSVHGDDLEGFQNRAHGPKCGSGTEDLPAKIVGVRDSDDRDMAGGATRIATLPDGCRLIEPWLTLKQHVEDDVRVEQGLHAPYLRRR